MGQFKFTETFIEGLYIIEPEAFSDNRGYFMETYNYEDFKINGLDVVFVQDNQSKSQKGVLRGMHFQTKHAQGKLVRVIKGEVFDVAVDLRKGSKTYRQWYGIFLSEENRRQFYVPEGFAHGFLVISKEAEFVYKCTDLYHPEYEGSIVWNDSDINIHWPLDIIEEPLLSEKDRNAQTLKQYEMKSDLDI